MRASRAVNVLAILAGTAALVSSSIMVMGQCIVSDDFSDGTPDGVWVYSTTGGVVSVMESGGRIRFSGSTNNGAIAAAFGFADGWALDMDSDWAASAWWYANPPVPTFGEVGLAIAVMLEVDFENQVLVYGASNNVGRYRDSTYNYRYASCVRWNDNEYSQVSGSPDYPYSTQSDNVYIWYDASDDILYFDDELYSNSPWQVTNFRANSGSSSDKALLGAGAFSFGYVPSFSSSKFQGDNWCVLEGEVIGPSVGACCVGDSCIQTIEHSCDGEWLGTATDCETCFEEPCPGDTNGTGI